MIINTSNWKEFLLTDLFNFENCKCNNASELEDGEDIEYIGAKKNDNGHMKFVKEEQNLITKGNCILFICDGQGSVGYTLYMPQDFIGSTTTCAGYNDNLNEKIGMFLVTILDLERPKYSFGRKYRTHLKDTYIKLPCTLDGNPDWKYMNDFIEGLLESARGESLKNLVRTNNSNPSAFNINKWNDYKFGDLLDEVYKGKSYVKSELEESDCRGIIFVSRTDNDNGCDGFIEGKINDYEYEKGNALIIGDTTSTCFYQEKDFICGDHIVVIRANWLNKYTGLFIKTLLEKERFKYNYGRSFKMELVKNTIIKLPSDSKGNPDWAWIENFIKSIPYADRI